jgi:poly(A) polymerase
MPSLEGKALGDRLKSLETEWIDSGFKLTKAELLK